MTKEEVATELVVINLLLLGWTQQRDALNKTIAFFEEKKSRLLLGPEHYEG